MKGFYPNKKARVSVIIFICLILIGINSTQVFGQSSTENGNSIREKVREKIEQVKSKPKALIGTVTDKTGDTIELKDKTGEIQLISINTNGVSFVKIGTSSGTIKFSDVAIGDFIVAMGFQSGNTVLSARRILLTKPLEDPNREIIFGKVLKINKKIVTITKKDGAEIDVEFGVRWKGPEIKEISENDTIAFVLVPNNGKNIIRTIEIINKSESASPTPKK